MRKKKIILSGIVAAAAAGVLLLSSSRKPSKSPSPPPPPPSFDVGIPTAQEVRNMLGVYGERVESTERELGALRAELEETRKVLKESVTALQAERRKDFSILETFLRDTPAETRPDPAAPSRFKTFEFPREGRGAKSLHLPAGSFGEATLLTGVYAPVTGEPLPVLLRLDAALVGPSKSRVPIRGAFLVGKAQGDANSRRAVVQLDTLSLVTDDGRTIEVNVNGWVIDIDGIQGLAGSYVWRADEILALAGASGGLAAAAEALSLRETARQVGPIGATETVTGDPLKFVGLRGAGGGLARLSELIAARLQEITPSIYVANGAKVTVAFISGVTLEGVESGSIRRGAFEGLDHE